MIFLAKVYFSRSLYAVLQFILRALPPLVTHSGGFLAADCGEFATACFFLALRSFPVLSAEGKTYVVRLAFRIFPMSNPSMRWCVGYLGRRNDLYGDADDLFEKSWSGGTSAWFDVRLL